MPPLLYKMLNCTLILWFCWKREYNSQSSVARNGNTRRLMVARGALCPTVDCQIIDNIPKPTRSCASGSRPASRESDSDRRAKPQAQIIIPASMARPAATKHDDRHSPRVLLALVHTHPDIHRAPARTPAHAAAPQGRLKSPSLARANSCRAKLAHSSFRWRKSN